MDLKGSELVIAVFAQYKNGSQFQAYDYSEIISSFYKSSKNKKYNSLFKNYAFDTDRIEPTSSKLSHGLDILIQSTLLNRNPFHIAVYDISRAVKLNYEKYIEPDLEANEISLIKELSEEIKENLGVVNYIN